MAKVTVDWWVMMVVKVSGEGNGILVGDEGDGRLVGDEGVEGQWQRGW